MNKDNFILADGRWLGQHGIGRFSEEIFSRLTHIDILTEGPRPLSPKNFAWLPLQLYKKQQQYKVFFMPGYNPVLHSPIPFIFTLCDLIPLDYPGKYKALKVWYYNLYIKTRSHAANKILTISEYSKQKIMQWANLTEDKVINIGCGVSQHLNKDGNKYTPGFPYLLHVGNTNVHKNVTRLVKAFAVAKIDPQIRLILTGRLNKELVGVIQKNQLDKRVIFSGPLTELQLADYYRGALAVMFPSLYEGFGLPVVEGMSCGVPVLTSNLTSLPEVAGDAALMVDPYDVYAMAAGIEKITQDISFREELIRKGFQQIKLFTWDKTAKAVQEILVEAAHTRPSADKVRNNEGKIS